MTTREAWVTGWVPDGAELETLLRAARYWQRQQDTARAAVQTAAAQHAHVIEAARQQAAAAVAAKRITAAVRVEAHRQQRAHEMAARIVHQHQALLKDVTAALAGWRALTAPVVAEAVGASAELLREVTPEEAAAPAVVDDAEAAALARGFTASGLADVVLSARDESGDASDVLVPALALFVLLVGATLYRYGELNQEARASIGSAATLLSLCLTVILALPRDSG